MSAHIYTLLAVRLSVCDCSHRLQCVGAISVQSACWWTFVAGTSVDTVPRAMHRCCIGGIYCSRYILICLRNLGMTRFANLDRPYSLLFSGHKLTAFSPAAHYSTWVSSITVACFHALARALRNSQNCAHDSTLKCSMSKLHNATMMRVTTLSSWWRAYTVEYHMGMRYL
jgi:hypothetical protein